MAPRVVAVALACLAFLCVSPRASAVVRDPAPIQVIKNAPSLGIVPQVVITPTPIPKNGKAVKIVSPAANSNVSGTVAISLQLAAAVNRVDVFVDGVYLESTPPTTLNWNTRKFRNGPHVLDAEGVNSANALVGFDDIIVNSNNPTPTPATRTPTKTPTRTPTRTPTKTPTPTPTPPVTSGQGGAAAFAIDCKTNRAYIPLQRLDPNTNHGRVAVLDLLKDPDKTNPLIATVVSSHPDIPHSVAIDPVKGLVFVPSGADLDVIQESTNHVIAHSPFFLPNFSDSGTNGLVAFDYKRNKGILSVQGQPGCPAAGTCTGFTVFDESAHTFSKVIPAPYPQSFAFNPNKNYVLDGGPFGEKVFVVNLGAATVCTLTDSNFGFAEFSLSIDPATEIFAQLSNHEELVNLHGARTVATPPPCKVVEGGTPPNSVTFAGSEGPSAVNPKTHDLWLAGGDPTRYVSLVNLPKTPVAKIIPAQLTITTEPLVGDPNNHAWITPNALSQPIVAANCPAKGDFGDALRGFGYALNGTRTFMVQVDLAHMQNVPMDITKPLLAGKCFGTTSMHSCHNGKGVTYFPLPQ